jgi:hypothetical protein
VANKDFKYSGNFQKLKQILVVVQFKPNQPWKYILGPVLLRQ